MREGVKNYPAEFFGVPRSGRTLIVGSKLYDGVEDRRRLYHDAVGVDMEEGDGVDILHNMEDAPLSERFAHVECISVLEHSPRPWLAARNIEESMQIGGTLWLSVPFIWRVHAYPSDYWRFTIEAVRSIFTRIEWAGLEYCSDGLIVKRPRRINHEGLLFLGKTEIIGVGVRC